MEMQERKRQLRQKLEELYPLDKNNRTLSYFTTWHVANTQPYHSSTEEEIVVRLNWVTLLISMLAVLAFGVFVMYKSKNGWMIGVPLFLIGIYLFIKLRDRKSRLVIDKNGIWYHKWNNTIPWEKIGATYIKKDWSGEDERELLVIHYYETAEEEFWAEEIDLTDFDISFDKVSYVIEYIKMKHCPGDWDHSTGS